MSLHELGIIEPIVRALDEQGYEQATPIQTQAIPPLLAGEDLLGCAQTGTGKTAAFAIPILQKLALEHPGVSNPRIIRALVVAPTRELALQIAESFEKYSAHLKLRTTVVFGGVSQNPQTQALKKGVDILVATPGRLLDLIGQGFVDISHISCFVLDEADQMLERGMLPEVKRIVHLLPNHRQTMFFSATMPPEIAKLADTLLRKPVKIDIKPPVTPLDVIVQEVYFVDKGNKTNLLMHILRTEEYDSVLVFSRTKHGAERIARDLRRKGFTAESIHGNKTQSNRQAALNSFKNREARILVATDIAARGLDIQELSHVVNYNLPEVPETYVHRIGRTGRAGLGGRAISFCDFEELILLKGVEKFIDREIPEHKDHPYPLMDTCLPPEPTLYHSGPARNADRNRPRSRGFGGGRRR